MANVLGQLFGDIAGAIREKTGEAGKMKPAEFPQKIRGISAGSGEYVVWADASASSGLVGSGIIRYVTFMNHDGTVEYGRKSVIQGENCVDPVSGGFLETPTRESTESYNYTYAGWATEPNGGLNANALKNVTEDRIVYANFVSAVRYYTVTFYDADGLTVLASKKYTYNTVPDYAPVKMGYTFSGWTPELQPVTEDTSYVASWIGKVDFNVLTWAQVEQYAKSGEAQKFLDLGAEKTFTTKQGVSVTARIIGFNHDDLADGTGKAGITLEVNVPANNQYINGNTISWGAGSSSVAKTLWWGNCDIRENWQKTGQTYYMLTGCIPDDLKKVIKTVRKPAYNTVNGVMSYSDDLLWLPSSKELGFDVGGSVYDEGECYAIYTPGKNSYTEYPELIKKNNGTAGIYFTRSKESNMQVGIVTATGTKSSENLGYSRNAFMCFCI